MSVWTQSLLWLSGILGAYIVFSSILNFFSSGNSCHNIGCILVPHSTNHTDDLITRKHRVDSQYNHTKSLAYHYNSIITHGHPFEKKTLEVARSFEKYTHELAEEKNMQQQDRDIYLAIQSA